MRRGRFLVRRRCDGNQVFLKNKNPLNTNIIQLPQEILFSRTDWVFDDNYDMILEWPSIPEDVVSAAGADKPEVVAIWCEVHRMELIICLIITGNPVRFLLWALLC
jgi:hypothetical protein